MVRIVAGKTGGVEGRSTTMGVAASPPPDTVRPVQTGRLGRSHEPPRQPDPRSNRWCAWHRGNVSAVAGSGSETRTSRDVNTSPAASAVVTPRALAGRSRSVVGIWAPWAAATLLLFVAAGHLRVVTLHPHMRSLYAEHHGPLWLLLGWDYRWYSAVAHGYNGTPSYAFFPLWPALLWVFGRVGAQGALAVLAAALMSALAFIGVAVSAPAPVSRRTALALASMPGSFALLLPYADGLALAFGSLAVFAARRGGWLWAASLAFLAAVARPNGFLLVLLVAGVAWGSTDRRRWVAVAAPIAGFVVVNCVFWASSGSPVAFLTAEKHWGRGGPTSLFSSVSEPWYDVQAAVAAAACVLVWLLWKARHRYGTSAFLYAGAVVGLSILSGTFAAFSRQMLFAFPLLWLAAELRFPYIRVAAVAGMAINIAGIFVLPRFFP
jgi:hypothetical protein